MGVGGQRHAPVVLPLPPNDLVPIVQENGWASGPIWTGAENVAPHRKYCVLPEENQVGRENVVIN